MDEARFDRLTLRVGAISTRRGVFRGVAAVLAASTGASLNEAGAAPRRQVVCRRPGAQCTSDRQCCTSLCQRFSSRGRSRRYQCACPEPQRNCGGSCVDLMTDPSNCGGCGTVCESGQCQSGVCLCPEGKVLEQGECVCANDDPCESDADCATNHFCSLGCCSAFGCLTFDGTNTPGGPNYCGGRLDGSEIYGCDGDNFIDNATCDSDADCAQDSGTGSNWEDCTSPDITCYCARSFSDGYFETASPTHCRFIRKDGTC